VISGRRMMMFESMIESVLMWGAEIWGWKEQGEVEKARLHREERVYQE
jgi:hypothetical protein